MALAKRLVQWADAVAENFAPRAMRGFGLDYASMVAEKPDLVMVSSCLQGQTGPHKDYPGFGGQGSALGGYNLLTGLARPRAGGPLRDHHRLPGAALRGQRPGGGPPLPTPHGQGRAPRREPRSRRPCTRCPRGCSTSTSTATSASRQGNRSDRAVPHGAFPAPARTAGWPSPAWDDDDWARLAGRHRASTRSRARFATFDARRAGVDEVEALVSAWTAHAPPAEVAETLQGAGLEAVPVADLGDASADPQLHHRGHFVTLEHPAWGRAATSATASVCRDAPAGFSRSEPHSGRAQRVRAGRDPRRRLPPSSTVSLDDGVLE